MTASAGKIGVSRQAVYALRLSDSEFKAEWEDAYESGTDAYEDEMKRRAIHGTEKPVFYQGEIVGHIREFSDTLLIVALKSRRPEKYRDNLKIEITNEDADKTINEALEKHNLPKPESFAGEPLVESEM